MTDLQHFCACYLQFMAVTPFCSDGTAVRYVLPVLRTTSHFYMWWHDVFMPLQRYRCNVVRRLTPPAASYWLRLVLDSGCRRDRTSPSYDGVGWYRGRSLHGTIYFLVDTVPPAGALSDRMWNRVARMRGDGAARRRRKSASRRARSRLQRSRRRRTCVRRAGDQLLSAATEAERKRDRRVRRGRDLRLAETELPPAGQRQGRLRHINDGANAP